MEGWHNQGQQGPGHQWHSIEGLMSRQSIVLVFDVSQQE